MFNLAKFGAEPTDKVGAEEAPLCWSAPSLKYHAHDGTRICFHFRKDIDMDRAITDAVGSVVFHPLHPLLLSVSGSRHFDDFDSDGDESSESSVLGEETSRGDTREVIRRHRHRPQPSSRDNSFRLWHFGEPSS